MSKKYNNLSKISLLVFLVGFFVHLLWEIAQMPLYTCGTLPFVEILPKLLLATFGDGAIMVLFYLVGVWKNKDSKWISRMKKRDYYIILVLGFIIAVIIELSNVQIMQRWDYTSLMPVIPILNVGLVPIIQLMVLPFIVFFIVRNMSIYK